MYEERDCIEDVIVWHPYPEDPPLRMDGYLVAFSSGSVVFARYQNGAFTLNDNFITWWAEKPQIGELI